MKGKTKVKYKDLKDKDIKLNNVTEKTKIVSVLCVLFFIAAIGICAYLLSWVDNNNVFNGRDGSKTYTISRALANGNKPGIISCLVVALFLLNYLITLRGPIRYLNLRRALIVLATGLIISLLWVTVNLSKDAHYTLASFIFLFILIFEINILYYFYLNNREDKSFFKSLIAISLVFTALLLIFACMSGKDINKDIFATFEIIFSILLIGIVLILGFYHN